MTKYTWICECCNEDFERYEGVLCDDCIKKNMDFNEPGCSEGELIMNFEKQLNMDLVKKANRSVLYLVLCNLLGIFVVIFNLLLSFYNFHHNSLWCIFNGVITGLLLYQLVFMSPKMLFNAIKWRKRIKEGNL